LQLDEKYKVNGELTIGENIGDLGGLGIAWKAYIISLNGKEPPVIDGLTERCRSASDELGTVLAQQESRRDRDSATCQLTRTHLPEFRCNQVVKNLDIFHETFEVQPRKMRCGLEPRMKRVVIW
jgi:putative endopeptidase